MIRFYHTLRRSKSTRSLSVSNSWWKKCLQEVFHNMHENTRAHAFRKTCACASGSSPAGQQGVFHQWSLLYSTNHNYCLWQNGASSISTKYINPLTNGMLVLLFSRPSWSLQLLSPFHITVCDLEYQKDPVCKIYEEVCLTAFHIQTTFRKAYKFYSFFWLLPFFSKYLLNRRRQKWMKGK